MKLLIITQVVDTEHPVLGFFHGWIEEFAKHCDQIHVICLQEGKHDLPSNVSVHSLGKEVGNGKLTYLYNFYKSAWKLRNEYDDIFVHMNQEYVLLGGIFWKLLKRRVTMWRNHYAGSLLTRLAGYLCDKVFYTSNYSYTADFSNSEQMPIGIDPEVFCEIKTERKKNSILYVGRISTSKHVKEILEAFNIYCQKNEQGHLTIVGSAPDKAGTSYENSLKKYATEHNLPVTFAGPVSWKELPLIYSANELCVNLSSPGMFDKVIGESLLCGCDIVTTNTDLKDILSNKVLESTAVKPLAEYFTSYEYDNSEVKRMSELVQARHSLPALAKKVIMSID